MLETAGKFRARATGMGLGKTSGGKPQVAVDFEVTEGDQQGEHITWFGYFTDATWERTIESLRYCGWTGGSNGKDVSIPDGISDNEVQIDVEIEEYNNEMRPKVRWVNPLGGGARMANPMSPDEASSFARSMMDRIGQMNTQTRKPAAAKPATAASQAPAESQLRDDDIPF